MRRIAAATLLAVGVLAGPACAADALKPGEYACFGSGGRPMIGLGFKVLSGGRYTDLDGKERGTFAVQGDKVVFKGGHMAKVEGRALKNQRFRVGAQAVCEPA